MWPCKKKEIEDKRWGVLSSAVLARFNELTKVDADDISDVECHKGWGGSLDSAVLKYYVEFQFKTICRKSWEFFVRPDTFEVLTRKEYEGVCQSMKSAGCAT